jgi:hypothetical protein
MALRRPTVRSRSAPRHHLGWGTIRHLLCPSEEVGSPQGYPLSHEGASLDSPVATAEPGRVRECPYPVMRAAVIGIAVIAWTCSSRRAAPGKQSEAGRPSAIVGVSESRRKRDRVVRLPSGHGDRSCLAHGGTVVANDLSDDDVRTIEALIRRADPLPLMRIDRPWLGGLPSDASGPAFQGMTGEGCGPLSGHGTLYWINRVGGEWQIVDGGQWAS